MLTCGGCDAEWSGLGRSHCSGCHRTYSAPGLFDRHRQATAGHNRCLDPARLRTKDGRPVMILDNGLWRSAETDNRFAE